MIYALYLAVSCLNATMAQCTPVRQSQTYPTYDQCVSAGMVWAQRPSHNYICWGEKS